MGDQALPADVQLDGELVAWDHTGRPDWHRLDARVLHGDTSVREVEMRDPEVERAAEIARLVSSGRSWPKFHQRPSETAGKSSPLRPQRRSAAAEYAKRRG